MQDRPRAHQSWKPAQVTPILGRAPSRCLEQDPHPSRVCALYAIMRNHPSRSQVDVGQFWPRFDPTWGESGSTSAKVAPTSPNLGPVSAELGRIGAGFGQTRADLAKACQICLSPAQVARPNSARKRPTLSLRPRIGPASPKYSRIWPTSANFGSMSAAHRDNLSRSGPNLGRRRPNLAWLDQVCADFDLIRGPDSTNAHCPDSSSGPVVQTLTLVGVCQHASEHAQLLHARFQTPELRPNVFRKLRNVVQVGRHLQCEFKQRVRLRR